ncbi:MAG TPA: sigma-70 family RNA polymerase sigma factor [Leucothrix mucor]|nr:sigma-70 family RNA polymerase sigma factor [Leucothrix mucor]
MTKKYPSFENQLICLIPRLRRYARTLAHSKQDQEDLVQATLERSIVKQHQWTNNTGLDRWVFTIQSSIWKNELRSRSYRTGNGVINVSVLMDKQATEKNEGTYLLNQVFNHVMTLPENQRTAIFLVYVEGLKYTEAADALEIPLGTLMSRLARGRLKLSEKLDKRDMFNDLADAKRGTVISLKTKEGFKR